MPERRKTQEAELQEALGKLPPNEMVVISMKLMDKTDSTLRPMTAAEAIEEIKEWEELGILEFEIKPDTE